MKTKNKCKTKHDPQARHMLERHLANSGPMTPQQTRAMWAKKNNPAAASASSAPPPRTFIPVPRVPVPVIMPRTPPPTGATMGESPARTPPTPPPDPMQEILDKINRIRQGLPADPPVDTSHPPFVIFDTANPASAQAMMPRTATPTPTASTPTQAGNGPITVARPLPTIPPLTLRHGPVTKPTTPPLRHGPIFNPTPGVPVKYSAPASPSFWKGRTPDPALKKKGKGRGTINNRFAIALHFLEQHGGVP